MTTSSSTSPKYPHVRVKLTGRDSNAFVILGTCRRAAQKAGVPQGEIAAFQAEAMAGDYGNLLRVCMSYFDVS